MVIKASIWFLPLNTNTDGRGPLVRKAEGPTGGDAGAEKRRDAEIKLRWGPPRDWWNTGTFPPTWPRATGMLIRSLE